MVLVAQVPAGLIELHINKKFQRPSENLDMEKESESTADLSGWPLSQLP